MGFYGYEMVSGLFYVSLIRIQLIDVRNVGYIVTIGFFIVLAAMLYDSKVANSPPVLMMLGALGSEFAAVCKFWFGSTSGSDRSQELLANSIPPGTK